VGTGTTGNASELWERLDKKAILLARSDAHERVKAVQSKSSRHRIREQASIQ
jgi:hypothetical protein